MEDTVKTRRNPLAWFSKHKKLTALLLVVLIAAVLVLRAVLGGKRAAGTTYQFVRTTTLQKTDLTDSVSVNGTVKSGYEASVTVADSAKLYKVSEVKVAVGDTVKKGDVIATLDTSDLEKQIESAEESYSDTLQSAQTSNDRAVADLETSTVQHENTLIDLQTKIEQADESLQDAKDDLTKAQEEQRKAQSTYDSAVSDYNTLESAYNAAVANVEALNAAYTTAQQTYAQAKNNYEVAVEIYNNDGGSPTEAHTQAKNDAEAYVSAAEYARLAINASGCTPLTQEQWEDPSNGFNSAMSNNAWIWGLALPSESVANLFCFTAHMSTENAWSAYGNDACRCINSNLYNSIDLRDFRRHSWLDPDRKDPEKESYDYKSCRKEGKEYFNELPDYANIKFRPAQGAYEDFKVGGAADHPYMRVEEMYFIEAEAKAHENLGEGIRLLNEFMNNYRIVGGGYDCTNMSSSVENFTNELMLQKRIEFWGEGIVMFDMKRLDMSTRRGYVGTNSPASYRLNTEGRAPYWNFVISRGETQNNPVIATQNNPDPSQTVKPWNG
mgnify:CR=1 FL=1